MVPEFNIASTDDGLEISGEFPRLQPNNLNLAIEGGVLKVTNNCTLSLVPFEKHLEVPQGYDLAKATAAFVNGVLRIKVPKKIS